MLARPRPIWAQLPKRRSCGGPTTLGGAAACAPFVLPSFMFAGHKLDGLKTVGINPVPFNPDFYILPAHFIFSDKFGIGTKYGISNSKTGRKRFDSYPFHISRIISGYPDFNNLVYTVFVAQVQSAQVPIVSLDSPTQINQGNSPYPTRPPRHG